jgi:hypothetical protein
MAAIHDGALDGKGAEIHARFISILFNEHAAWALVKPHVSVSG